MILRILMFGAIFVMISTTTFGITLPWSTTFDCADWQSPNALSCNGIGVYGPSQSCSGTVSRINSAGNNLGGGGGKGWRVSIGDGINVQGAAPRINFSPAPSEVWFRWYMRFPVGFAWSNIDYHKLIYVDTMSQMNMGCYEFYGSNVRYFDQYGGTGTHLGTSGRGFYWVNGSVGDGLWHYYELHLKTNTSGNNGVAEAWIDGTKILASNTVNFGGANFDGFNLNVNQRSPANGGCVFVDYDDFAISTTGYIGPLGGGGGGTIPPSVPTNLRLGP